jgi:glycosyltransferase involved in cell wall biosynthesis
MSSGRGPGTHPAADALAAGQAAQTAEEALRWFDRAARLAPGDPVVALALAAACVAEDPGRAAALFASVRAEDRPREGWWGLAAARLALGDIPAAAQAAGRALARFVLAEAFMPLAGAVARAAGAAGWCGVATGDGVVVALADSGGRAEIRVDGRAVPIEGLTAAAGRRLAVRAGPGGVLGSPLRLDLIRRVVGGVAAEAGGLRGWAWRPADPEAVPEVTVRGRGALALRVACTGPAPADLLAGPLLRARGFSVPASALVGFGRRRLRVSAEGRDLPGSPLDPAEAAERTDRGPPRAMPRRRRPAVVIPLLRAEQPAAACVRAVLATVPAGTVVVVVDDAAEPACARELRALAAAGRLRLIRHRLPLGEAAAVSAGVAACAGRDVVLVDPGAMPAPGWLARLRAAADAAPDIGSVVPLSNAPGPAAYPDPVAGGPMPDPPMAAWLSALAWRVHGARTVEAPAEPGPCLYVRRACWAAAGPLRAAPFAPGHGTLGAFLRRAQALGWRHVAAPGVFVAQAGSTPAAEPGADALAPARRRLDRARVEAARRMGLLTAAVPLVAAPEEPPADRVSQPGGPRPAPAVLLITHPDGGGVERVVAASCRAHRLAGRRTLVLRPGTGPERGLGAVLGDAPADDTPNLRFALPREVAGLRRLLQAEPLVGIELHHLLGHHPAVADLVGALGVPYEVYVHDYAWACPRVVLTQPDPADPAPGHRYCGAPDLPGCEACVAAHGSLLDETIGVRALRRRSAALLLGARAVVVPSADAAARLRRFFPTLVPRIVAPEDDSALRPAAPPSAGAAGRLRVAVVGAIGPAKGVEVLLACARDAARRDLPLEFVVVGPTTEDRALLATGRVFVTGPFRAEEADSLIRAQRAGLALLPSIWPETWCFALTDAWRAGLDVAAFDLGAPAARIRATGRGFLLPPALPAGRINEMLLARVARPVHQ